MMSSKKSGNLHSPWTPNYQHVSGGMNKGWSSERVPLQESANRRQVVTLLPFNNERTLPSKWEDAERCIFSPVAGEGFVKPSCQQQQSGPLGPPDIAYYSLYSPAISMYYESNINNHLIAASPFSAGVMMNAAVSVRGGNNGNFEDLVEPCIARSASVHGCSHLVCQSSGTNSQDCVKMVSKKKDKAKKNVNDESTPPEVSTEPTSTQKYSQVAETVTTSESSKARGKRGSAQMYKVLTKKAQNKKLKITFNLKGNPCGENRATFQSYIGMLARKMVPINIDCWNKVSIDLKEKLWEDIQETFKVIPEQYAFVGKQNWRAFVKSRCSYEWMETHEKQSERVKKRKFTQGTARASYIGLGERLKKERNMDSDYELGRHIMWNTAHTPKDGVLDENLKEC